MKTVLIFAAASEAGGPAMLCAFPVRGFLCVATGYGDKVCPPFETSRPAGTAFGT